MQTDAIRRITVEATQKGVAETTAGLKGLAAAHESVVGVSERQERASLSVERALERERRALDQNYRAMKQFEAAQATLDKGRAQGFFDKDQDQYAKLTLANIARYEAAIKPVGAASEKVASQVGLARHELINLSRQAQDVGVSLASGQSPFTVLVQQGTQIADVFANSRATVGSFFGQIGGFLGRVLTPLRVFVGAAAGIAAAGVAAALAWGDAQRQIDVALTGIGRASGVTRTEINRIASSSASTFGLSVSEAREFASELAKTGRIGKDNIEPIVRIGKDLSTALGVDVAEAARLAGKAFSDPVQGAQELNNRLGFLDGAMLRHLTNLTAQNRMYEAQALLLVSVRDALKDVQVNVSTSTNFWTALGNKISNAAGAVGEFAARATGIGLRLGLDEQIEASTRRIADLQRQLDAFDNAGSRSGRRRSTVIALMDAEKAKLQELQGSWARYWDSVQGAQERRDSLPNTRTTLAQLPELDQRQSLVNAQMQMGLLKRAIEATGGANSTILKAMAVDWQQFLAAVERAGDGVKAFRTTFEQAMEANKLAMQAATAFSPLQKGEIAYLQAKAQLQDQVAAKVMSEAQAEQIAQGARTVAIKQATTALSEAARERELNAAQTVQQAFLEVQIAGRSIEDQNRLRAEQQARFQLEQEAGRNRTEVDERHLAKIKEQAAETARLRQIEAERKAGFDLEFQRAQMGRDDMEQKVAERLRTLYGEEYPRYMNSAIAAQVRFNEALRMTQELGSSALTGFLQDVRAGKSPIEAIINQLARVGDKFVDIGAKKFFGNGGVFGTAQGQGLDFGDFAKGVQKGVAGGMADWARSLPGNDGNAGGAIQGGLAGIGVLASAYQTGRGTTSPIAGGLTGALTGAAGGFAIAGPFGAAFGAVAGGLAGLFGALSKAAEEADKAAKAWRDMSVRFRVFIATMEGNAPGTFGQAIAQAEDQLKQFVETAQKAGDTKALQTAADALDHYKQRLTTQFKAMFDETLRALEEGFGTNSTFLTAANNIQSLSDQIKSLAADAQQAFSMQNMPTGMQGAFGGLGSNFSGAWDAAVAGGADQAEAVRKAGRDYLLALLAGVKPLSEVATKLQTLDGMAAQLQVSLVDLGLSAAQASLAISEKLNVALGKLRDDFIDGITRKLNEADGKSFINDIADLIKERDQMVADARALGVDPTLIGRYFAVQAQKIVDGADLVGASFADLLAVFPELSGVVHESTTAINAEIEKQQQAIAEASNFIAGVTRNITEWLADVRAGSQSPLSPGARLSTAQSTFAQQLAFAQAGDRTALSGITQFADTYLEAARGVYASSSAYQTIFNQVTAALQNLPALLSPEQLVANSVDSMKAAVVAAIGLNSPAAIAAALLPMFNTLDTSVDQGLTFSEFQVGLQGIADNATLRNIFDGLDANKNGIVDKLELVKTVLKASIDAGSADAIKAALGTYFDTLNTTADQGLTFSELVAGVNGLARDTSVSNLLTQSQLAALGLSTNATVSGLLTQTQLAALNLSKDTTVGSLLTQSQLAALGLSTNATTGTLLTRDQLAALGLSTDAKITTLLTRDQLAALGLSLNSTVGGLLTQAQLAALGLSTDAAVSALDAGNLLRIFQELDGNGNGILEKSELIKTNTGSTSTNVADMTAQVVAMKALTDSSNQLTASSNQLLAAANQLVANPGGTNDLLNQIKSLNDTSKGQLSILNDNFGRASTSAGSYITNPYAQGGLAAPKTIDNLSGDAITVLRKIAFNTAAIANNTSGFQAATKYAGVFGAGGWVDGPSHARGGVYLNAEGGEFIVNRNAARALSPFLADINRGRLPVLGASGANDNAEVVAELRATRRELAQMKREHGAQRAQIAELLGQVRDLLAALNGETAAWRVEDKRRARSGAAGRAA